MLTVKSNSALVGKTVVVERIGELPCEAVVVAVDEITGLITRVRMKDVDGVVKIVDVTGTVVRLISPIREIIRWVRSLFKRS